MNLLPVWLRKWLRFPCAPVRRSAPRVRLNLEALEDRLIPSASPLTDPTYAAWRQQTFRLDDAVLTPVASAASSVAALSSAPSNASFGSLIGLNQVLAGTSYRGTGYTVAVIDTGINYNDPDLGGGWGRRVVGGYNFVNNTTNPMDDHGHGTFVAGEIASSSTTYSGVAPNANLIALKVLDSSGSGSFGNVENALQWVIANQAQHHIVAINLSLGSGNHTVNPYTFLENEFATLKSQGVFISVAAGNDYFAAGSIAGLAYPATSANVVSVGAVYAGNFGAVSFASGARDYSTSADKIASFSQRAAAMSLLAPGAIIAGDALNGGIATMAGTSMASPIVAGAAVLLHEALDFQSLGANANQDYILNLMRSTGKVVVDVNNGADNVGHTGLSFRRLDLAAAIDSIVPVSHGPTIGAIADQTVNAGQPAQVTVSTSSSSDGAVTWSAQAKTAAQAAYALQQQLNLAYTGNYHTNLHGMNEKWLWSYTMGGLAVCILPDGTLRHYDPAGKSAMLGDANLLGRVDSAYYVNPLSLAGIKPPASMAAPAAMSIAGAQLTVTPNASASGPLYVVVTATDGKATVRTTFVVNIATASAPAIASIADRIVNVGQSATVTVSASKSNGSPANWQAQVQTAAQAAAAAQQQWQLAYTGNYWTNLHGMNEKWLWSYTLGGLAVCILPDGTLRRYDGNGASAILGDGNWLGRVDPSFYADPQRLTAIVGSASATAAAVVPPTVASLSVSGSKLTVTPNTSFVGNLFVVITASDGSVSTRKSFMVTAR